MKTGDIEKMYNYKNEADFANAVIEKLRSYSSTRVIDNQDTDAKFGKSGEPDLLVIKPDRSIFIELKTGYNDYRASKIQKATLQKLREDGFEAYILYPENWEEKIDKLMDGK